MDDCLRFLAVYCKDIRPNSLLPQLHWNQGSYTNVANGRIWPFSVVQTTKYSPYRKNIHPLFSTTVPTSCVSSQIVSLPIFLRHYSKSWAPFISSLTMPRNLNIQLPAGRPLLDNCVLTPTACSRTISKTSVELPLQMLCSWIFTTIRLLGSCPLPGFYSIALIRHFLCSLPWYPTLCNR